MISSRRTKLTAFAGLILVFITVVIFMQLFPVQENLHWASLVFIILGEALPIAGFIWLEDTYGQRIGPGLRVGIYALFFVYGLAAVSLSLILLLLNVKASFLATLEIILVLAFGAIFLFAVAAGGERSKSRTDTAAAVAFMRYLEDEVYTLAREQENRAYATQLNHIEEAIRYSDYSGRSDMDPALAEKIRELKYVLREEGDAADLNKRTRERQVFLLTEDILRLVQNRNHELLSKRKERNLSNG